MDMPSAVPRRGALAWAFYDWANSAYASVITTFVFAAYFAKAVAADPVKGTADWGYALSLSALAVALTAPVLGAVADHAGRRKPWIGLFTAVMVVFTWALWYVRPDPSCALLALVLVGIGNFAFETATVFYNAMLPDVAGPGRIGRVSGWAWGLGYAGGIVCLGVLMVGFIQAETPWFGLDKSTAEHLRAAGPFVAVWTAVFALPLFLFTPDTPATGMPLGQAVRQGMGTLAGTLRKARKYEGVIPFLAAFMIYSDGLTTLFAFGGIYAAGTFHMDFAEIVIFGIGMNVTAGLGAAAFAWADDAIGPKRTVLVSLAALIVFGAAIVLVTDKHWFLGLALALGVFVGPAQSAGRSMMAHLAPREIRTELFGFKALAGKATSFLGPAVLAAVTDASGSQRLGVATILIFFAVGFLLFLRVPDARGH